MATATAIIIKLIATATAIIIKLIATATAIIRPENHLKIFISTCHYSVNIQRSLNLG